MPDHEIIGINARIAANAGGTITVSPCRSRLTRVE